MSETRRTKPLLIERLSIADDVKIMSTNVINSITNEVRRNVQTYVHNDILYKTGETNVDISDEFKGFKLKYLVYLFRNTNEFKDKMADMGTLICESDYVKKFIRISTFIVGDQWSSDFNGSVLHEINHLYQSYKGGGNKNEDRYSTSTRLYQSQNKIEKWIGATMYMSFPHEQDAMTNQFYGFLKQNYLNSETPPSLEGVIRYSEWQKMENALDNLWDRKDEFKFKHDIEEVLQVNFNMTIERFFEYTTKTSNRFLSKIKHAYKLFHQEYNERQLSENASLHHIKVESLNDFYRLIGVNRRNNLDFIYK